MYAKLTPGFHLPPGIVKALMEIEVYR